MHPLTAETPRRRADRSALPTELHPEQRLDRHQVMALVGVRRTKLDDLIVKEGFPAAERLGPRCSRWRAGLVLSWLNAKAAA